MKPAEHGYEGLSLAAVADDAGTTRPAVYRRWPGKAELATAAIAALSTADTREATDDPYADPVAELAAFRTGVTRPDGLSLVGTMLQRGTDPKLLRLYRERLVIPRRTRLRAILERALARGLLPGGDPRPRCCVTDRIVLRARPRRIHPHPLAHACSRTRLALPRRHPTNRPRRGRTDQASLSDSRLGRHRARNGDALCLREGVIG